MVRIRPLRTGGSSICVASDENVGKRRCNHILTDAKIVHVKRENGVSLIDISGVEDGDSQSFSIKASEKKVQEYIVNLSNGLDDKKKQEILAALR